MAKMIETGIKQIAASSRIEHEPQWQAIRNNLNSQLLSSHMVKSDECRQISLQLDAMTHNDRVDYITQCFGPQTLAKVLPLLDQMNRFEQLSAADAADAKLAE